MWFKYNLLNGMRAEIITRPGPGDVAVVRHTEAPGKLDSPLVIPILVPVENGGLEATSVSRGRMRTGPSWEIASVLGQLDAERLGQLAGARVQLLVAHRGRPSGERRARIASSPSSGSQGADQHRGTDALGLAGRVQHRVDAIGAVHIGAARRAEQRGACAASARRTRGMPALTRGRPRSRRSPRWSGVRRRERARRRSRSTRGRPRAPGSRVEVRTHK